MNKVEEFLKENGIEYELHIHPAVFTVEEAAKHKEAVPGMACKNLLICTKDDKRLFLVTLEANKRFDFKKFGEIVGNKKLTFANAEELKQLLGLEAGAVSPFGLLNDNENKVVYYMDRPVAQAQLLGFHPNINTATIGISQANFRKFLQALKRELIIMDL